MFTRRQIEIIKLKTVEGLSNREIAERLNISESAVSQHLKALRQRIKAARDVIRLYTEIGLIQETTFQFTDRGLAVLEETRRRVKERITRIRFSEEEPLQMVVAPIIFTPSYPYEKGSYSIILRRPRSEFPFWSRVPYSVASVVYERGLTISLHIPTR